jgi:lipoprotein-releasing system permease protein
LIFPLYIARRYLFSKKSFNIINIISAIAVGGVAAGTMALIVVLSVFNGFENLISTLFNSFNPDVKISAVSGKIFRISPASTLEIKNIPGIKKYIEVVEDNALLKYKDNQHIGIIKGVSGNFAVLNRLDTMITEGSFTIMQNGFPRAVIGAGVQYYLGVNLNDFTTPLSIWVPRRTASLSDDPSSAFKSENIFASGVFSVQQDFDTKYVIVPIDYARNLFEYSNELTSIELEIEPGYNNGKIIKQLGKTLGNKFLIQNRFQQEELLYKIMKSEKLSIFLILSFIILIAAFNIVGSVSMLIIDKKRDISIMKSLGAENSVVKKIFLAEGLMISVAGCLIGLMLGFILCVLQIKFGLVPLGTHQGAFIVNFYPVEMQLKDFILVFIIVFIIGLLASWLLVRQISNRHLRQKIDFQ